MILGITGCPGSGKSLLARHIADTGWMFVDADDIGREVVEGDVGIIEALRNTFGEDIVGNDGRLDRRLLARRAFSDAEHTKRLNGIVHPELIKRLKARIEGQRGESRKAVVDCALIFEWGIGESFDCVVCVAADEHLRRARLRERDGRSVMEIDDMFAAQMPESDKIRRADITVMNNESMQRIKKIGTMLAEIDRYYI